jgi:hypothetical protein
VATLGIAHYLLKEAQFSMVSFTLQNPLLIGATVIAGVLSQVALGQANDLLKVKKVKQWLTRIQSVCNNLRNQMAWVDQKWAQGECVVEAVE